MFQKGTPATGRENLRNYFLSVKMDGLRAAWDGKQFVSRDGIIYPAPDDFKLLMPQPSALIYGGDILDGELWMGTNSFQECSSVVRGAGNDWLGRGVTYHVFDYMGTDHRFGERVGHMNWLEDHVRIPESPWSIVEQERLDQHYMTADWLLDRLKAIAKMGAEGYMLHHADSVYKEGRTRDLLKLKLPDFNWCVVVKPYDGKGKYDGMIGGYVVTGKKGTIFAGKEWRIGSGLDDLQRMNPLPKGAELRFKHWGAFKSGKPRQPVFCDIAAKRTPF